MVVPAIMLVVSLFYLFVVVHMDQPATVKFGISIAATINQFISM